MLQDVTDDRTVCRLAPVASTENWFTYAAIHTWLGWGVFVQRDSFNGSTAFSCQMENSLI